MGLPQEGEKGLRRLRALVIPSAFLLGGIVLAVAIIGYLDTRSSVNELDNRAADLRVQMEALAAATPSAAAGPQDNTSRNVVAGLQDQIDDMDRQLSGLQATVQRLERSGQPSATVSDWVVIEKRQSDIADEQGITKQTLTLIYSTPHGETASWQGEVFWVETPDGSGALEMRNEHFLDCWSNARVGEALPSCARR